MSLFRALGSVAFKQVAKKVGRTVAREFKDIAKSTVNKTGTLSGKKIAKTVKKASDIGGIAYGAYLVGEGIYEGEAFDVAQGTLDIASPYAGLGVRAADYLSDGSVSKTINDLFSEASKPIDPFKKDTNEDPSEEKEPQEKKDEKFMWVTKKDDRVRPSHARLHGKIFSKATGANGKFPGQDPGCRCVMRDIKQ